MKRSEKMYANSPKLERNEEGKMGITRAEKKSAEVNSGTDGVQENDVEATDLHQRHAKERLELYHKHEKEHLDMTHKSIKSRAEKAPEEGASGEELINKVEKDKGE